jgi:hypothetical protein
MKTITKKRIYIDDNEWRKWKKTLQDNESTIKELASYMGYSYHRLYMKYRIFGFDPHEMDLINEYFKNL